MKKKIVCTTVVLFLLSALVLGITWFCSNRIVLGEEILDRDITSLKISEKELLNVEKLQKLMRLEYLDLMDLDLTTEEFENLSENLPDCVIRWNVPFQGQRFDCYSYQLRLQELSEEDILQIKYFPKLKTIYADSCEDYDQLLKLRICYPNINVQFGIHIAGFSYPLDTSEITFNDVELEWIHTALDYLPQLQDIYLKGNVPENDVMSELKANYPDVTFHWNFSILGVETSSTARELILNDIPMENVDTVEVALQCFYNLEWVEMCNCGIPSEEMDALWKRHPETRFVWTIHIRKAEVRTDVTALIPIKLGYYMWNRLSDKDCEEMKYLVDLVALDMGHMDITDYSFLKYMPKLQYLILIDTKGKDFSDLIYLDELIYLELFYTKFTQTELLLELPKLQDLNIGFTPRPNQEVLQQMTWLERLWLPRTGLSNAELRVLQQALPNTQVVMNIEHSTAGNWRDNDNYRAMRDLLGMKYMK